MSQYLNLKVKQILRETDEAITIVFHQPQEKVVYKPGQFLTLIIDIGNEKYRRSYSLSSSPFTDQDLAVTVKKVTGGKVSSYLLDHVKVGDTLEVMKPLGTFTTECNYHHRRSIVLIGAGSGITPLISIGKSILSQEPLSNVFLILGNRNEHSVIFKQYLLDLGKEHGDRFHCTHVLSQPLSGTALPSGRLNQSSLIKILETLKNVEVQRAEYFICGPQGMMEEADKALAILQVPSSNIHKESFVAGNSGEAPSGEVVSGNKEITAQEVVILYQGSEYRFVVPTGKTILEAALKEDIDLPYSCQSGMCTACMGKCTSGKVKLDDPDGLSDREIQQGFVLTCVGHPASANVVIEID
jgi:ring-1,2-phenylacetyl-CoA epoxidase subunit PaaE